MRHEEREAIRFHAMLVGLILAGFIAGCAAAVIYVEFFVLGVS
jgi:hypothetical protein